MVVLERSTRRSHTSMQFADGSMDLYTITFGIRNVTHIDVRAHAVFLPAIRSYAVLCAACVVGSASSAEARWPLYVLGVQVRWTLLPSRVRQLTGFAPSVKCNTPYWTQCMTSYV